MAEIHNEVQKDQLALYLAGGGVTDRARPNGFLDCTVYSRSRSPEVSDRIESLCRAVLAEAVEQLGGPCGRRGRVIRTTGRAGSGRSPKLTVWRREAPIRGK